jgi:hypothetical protein
MTVKIPAFSLPIISLLLSLTSAISSLQKVESVHRKIRELLKAGARQVWIVYPETHSVDVWTVSGAQTMEAKDTLDGGDVLPGFRLLVAAIFTS